MTEAKVSREETVWGRARPQLTPCSACTCTEALSWVPRVLSQRAHHVVVWPWANDSVPINLFHNHVLRGLPRTQ